MPMPTPVRVHRTHVPCATSTPMRSLGPAGGCGYVYTFAELVSDSLRHLSRLDDDESVAAFRCVWSAAAVALGGGREALPRAAARFIQ